MIRRVVIAAIVLAAGSALALGVAALFGFRLSGAAMDSLLFFVLILGVLPAVLALLPTRAAFIVLALLVVVGGGLSVSVMNSYGDGSVYGTFLLVLVAVLAIFGLAVIAFARRHRQPRERFSDSPYDI